MNIKQLESVVLRNAVPLDTWCLVDSNQRLDTVPDCISDSCRFFIQSTSPRKNRLKWRNKTTVRASVYVMRDWSLYELVCGLQLQREKNFTTPVQLKLFYEQFGGSARDAYGGAQDPVNFRKGLQQLATNFHADLLVKPIIAAEPRTDDLVVIDPDNSHKFLSVFPVSDADRTQFSIQPPSKTVLNIVLEMVTRQMEQSAADLFHQLLASGKSISERTIAAYYYNGNFFRHLTSNRSLPCYPMEPSTVRLQDQVSRSWTTNALEPHHIQMQSLPMHYFDSRALPPEWRIGVLYVPNTQNFPTMDAFWVRSKSHVVMFQATISGSLTFSLEGLKWLASQGFESAEYSYVSPSTVTSASLSLPVSVPDSLTYKDFDIPENDILFPPVRATTVSPGISTLPLKIIRLYHVVLDLKDREDKEQALGEPASKKAKLM
ncbi:hypothetical protein D9757_013882 [Collybiopsis confluens]|uniref:Uncharacterized protein n=1 Tax=Collybiopsis confluens TaxID=2823264 RepID=A0A8H5CM67_9AGAR|nr:hypothetical protein D9757_013882 [Collybiopsis confluens]